MAAQSDEVADLNNGAALEMGTLDSSGEAEGLKVMVHNNNIQEASVMFLVKDTTDTDWKRSRYTYSLPLSTAVTDLYSAIAKETGVCPTS